MISEGRYAWFLPMYVPAETGSKVVNPVFPAEMTLLST